MSHLAIARKWRPQVFDDLIGQHHISRTLQNAIRLDRVHHAFLFTGARGVGKTSAARVLARALNCENRPETANPCNECSACKEMLSGSFPDVVEIDAASHNSVDDIRDLVDKARYTPQRGRFKVYIIDEVHMVTKQGFNALLKTLEEPPAHVIFILATTDPQKLLDTVVSRCQRFDFKMIPIRTVYEHLKHVAMEEGVSLPDASLMTMAREGGGSMRDAQSLLDQVLSFSEGAISEHEVTEILGFIDRSVLYETLEATLAGDPGTALEVLGRVRLFGYDIRSFSGQLLEAVRNVLIVRLVDEASKLMDLPDEEIVRLRAMASDRDPSLLRQQFDCLAETVDAITRSEQPHLLLEMAVVKMAAVRPFIPIDALLDRLENLEQRLARAGVRPSGGSDGGGGSSRGRVQSPAPSAPAPSFQRTAPKEAAPDHVDAPLTAPVLAARPPAPTPTPRPPEAARVGDILSFKRGASAPAPTPAPAPVVEPTPAPKRAPSELIVRHDNAAREPLAAPSPDRPDPAGGALCDASAWRQFVHSLADDDGLTVLRGMLARGGFLANEGDTIRVGFTSPVTLRNVEAELRDPALCGAIRDWFGRDLTLECSLDEAGASGRSLADELDRLRADTTARLRAEALASVEVGNTMQVFPGAVVLGEPRIPELQEITDVQ